MGKQTCGVLWIEQRPNASVLKEAAGKKLNYSDRVIRHTLFILGTQQSQKNRCNGKYRGRGRSRGQKTQRKVPSEMDGQTERNKQTQDARDNTGQRRMEAANRCQSNRSLNPHEVKGPKRSLMQADDARLITK